MLGVELGLGLFQDSLPVAEGGAGQASGSWDASVQDRCQGYVQWLGAGVFMCGSDPYTVSGRLSYPTCSPIFITPDSDPPLKAHFPASGFPSSSSIPPWISPFLPR